MPYLAELTQKRFKKTVLIKIFQIILILGISISLSFVFFQKINKESNEFVEKRKTIKEIQSLSETEVILKKDYTEVKDYLDKVIYFLPTEDNTVEIVAFLEKIAQLTENSQKIAIGDTKPYKENLSKIGCRVELSGNLSSFLKYCQEFEKSPYFLNMENIELIGVKGLEKSGQMVFQTSFIVRKK